MSESRIRFGDGETILLEGETFKPGDQPPADHDYLGWHAWADVQYKNGLRQSQCDYCGKWKFPQEIGERGTSTMCDTRGRVHAVPVVKCHLCIADAERARKETTK